MRCSACWPSAVTSTSSGRAWMPRRGRTLLRISCSSLASSAFAVSAAQSSISGRLSVSWLASRHSATGNSERSSCEPTKGNGNCCQSGGTDRRPSIRRESAELALPDRRLDRRRLARSAQRIAAQRRIARVADVDAAARPRLEVPVRDEALVGARDRVARDLELPRERARRGQVLRRRERSDRDALDDALADLVLQVQRLAPVDREQRHGPGLPFLRLAHRASSASSAAAAGTR